MRLGIDLDGVVANFDETWINRYNREFGTSTEVDSVTDWAPLSKLTHFANADEFWEWARDFGNGSLFRQLEPYPGAIEALEALVADGHHVVILTAKPAWWAVHDTFAWLGEHRLPTREVHVLEEKWLVPCDIYLDDAPHVLRGLARNRPDATVCRYVRPWNRAIPGVIDVSGWKEFAWIVEEAETSSA